MIRYNSQKNTTLVKKQNIIRRNIPIIMAFIIPVAILLLIFIAREIYPFGDEMYLISDMYHQYAIFLKEFQSILKNGDSLLYTWNIGLGSDFIGTYAYYLASPVNWLVCFLPSDNIPEIMSGFIIIKAGLMSATMAFYLKKHFGKNTFVNTAFGIFYGLSSYMAAYSWNLMWLDCLVLLPLIVLGLESLVRENKVSLYTITLAVCILSNYYISIMICIFLVLYFLYLIFCDRNGQGIFRVLGRFAGYSILAGAAAAVLLLPTMYTMLGSASNSFSFPTFVYWYFDFSEMVSHAAMNVEVTMLSGYIPNIYCTIGLFMFIPLFWFCRNIRMRERIGKTVLMGIFLVSFMMNIPNYIWHGFHYPNCLSARQSFIYIFLVLVIAYEATINIEKYRYITIAICYLAGAAALFGLYYLYQDEESYPFSITVISVIFLTLYLLWAILKRTQRIPAAILAFVIVAVAICEAGINTNSTGYLTNNRSSYMSDNDAIEELMEMIDDEDGFYRMEKISRLTKNDGAWSNYMSASLFSSSALASISDFYEEMGMQSSFNSYSYYGHTPVINAILGIEYELSSYAIEDDSLMTLIAETDGIYLYENKYTLSLGFAVNSAIAQNQYAAASNPFEAQNLFLESACGVSDVFTVYYTANDTSVTASATKAGRQYIYIEEWIDSVLVTVSRDGAVIFEKEYTGLENPQIIEVCDVQAGDLITVSSTDSDVSYITVINAIMDYGELEQAMELLADEQYEISEFSDAYVSGEITVSEDCIMFTSVPAENGWKVYVDGEKIEYDLYEDAFIMISLTAGTHTVEFKYAPSGLYYGALISLLSILIFILLMIRRRAKRKTIPAVYRGTDNKREAFDGGKEEEPAEQYLVEGSTEPEHPALN